MRNTRFIAIAIALAVALAIGPVRLPAFSVTTVDLLSLIILPPLFGAALLYGVLALFARVHPIVYALAVITFAAVAWGDLWLCTALSKDFDGTKQLIFIAFGLTGGSFTIVTWRFIRARRRLLADRLPT